MIWGKTTEEQLWEYRKHKWFAWYPVALDNGQWVWWEWIWRQKESQIRDGDNWSRKLIKEL